MSTAPATRYIDQLGLVFRKQEDKERYEPQLEGRIVRVELEEGNGDRWVVRSAEDDVEGHASGNTITLVGEINPDEEDVEGHYHPGTYAPRFDLQTRDFEAKAALQQALKEDRLQSIELQDSQGRVARINLLDRATGFILDHVTAARQAANTVLRYQL